MEIYIVDIGGGGGTDTTEVKKILDRTITECTLPDGLTEVGDSAFRDCDALSSVTIPSTVTSIGDNSFNGCSSLVSLTFKGQTAPTVTDSSFGDLPSTIEVTYPTGANYTNVISKINAGKAPYYIVKNLNTGDVAFDYTTSVNQNMFGGYDNYSLEMFNCNASWASFSGNQSIKKLKLTGNSTIDGYAFANCINLTEVDTTEYTGSGLDGWALFGIPCDIVTGTTLVHGNAFVSGYTVSNNITAIGPSCFFAEGYPNLKSITIPSSVTSIGGGAFRGQSQLTSIAIPSGVTTINSLICYDCSNLSSITFYGMTAPTLDGELWFTNVAQSGTLYYPDGATGYDSIIAQLPDGWTTDTI